MTLYQASAQAVTCGFSVLAEDINLTVTFVYAYNVAEERCSLWEELSLLNASTPVSRFPWAVIGDFNQILRSDQHSNHPDIDVDAAGIDDFTLAMQEAELLNLTLRVSPSLGGTIRMITQSLKGLITSL